MGKDRKRKRGISFLEYALLAALVGIVGAVGERLRAVARHHQVIAITHLAQSAVYGARHFAVSKTVSGGRTRSAIQEIEGEARVAEIARMLGGAHLTSVAEQHARELLELASPARRP